MTMCSPNRTLRRAQWPNRRAWFVSYLNQTDLVVARWKTYCLLQPTVSSSSPSMTSTIEDPKPLQRAVSQVINLQFKKFVTIKIKSILLFLTERRTSGQRHFGSTGHFFLDTDCWLGSVLENEATFTDHNATASGSGTSGRENLHRQVGILVQRLRTNKDKDRMYQRLSLRLNY